MKANNTCTNPSVRSRSTINIVFPILLACLLLGLASCSSKTAYGCYDIGLNDYPTDSRISTAIEQTTYSLTFKNQESCVE